MRARYRRPAVIVFLILATACGSHSPRPAPSVSSAPPSEGQVNAPPLVDRAPYWCDLVPKEALEQVSGSLRDLTEFRPPTNSRDQALCGVRDGQAHGPLGVTWDLKDGRELIAAARRQVAADHPRSLPVGLGSGFSVYSPRSAQLPYEVAALFRCGSHEPWIYISLRRMAPGRDVTEDLTGLMRVAERRFGVLHHCAPVASG